MILACGCGGILESLMLLLAGGITLGTFWGLLRARVAHLFRRN